MSKAPEPVELLPCPFCGGADDVKLIHDDFDWWAECEACDSRSAYKKEQEQAIAAWNTRAGVNR